jgi:uncharacterized protein
MLQVNITIDDPRWERLATTISAYPNALIAFSGGLDSSFLLFAAHRVLGGRAIGVIAVSPAVPQWDLDNARSLRDALGLNVRFLTTDLLNNDNYAENTPLRCYYCKEDLYRRLHDMRDREGWAVIFNGTVTDDLGDYRPGLRAAEDARVTSPYLEAELSKNDVRDLTRLFGLPFSDRPSSPCLASRIPHGTRVTLASLRRVQSAESALRALGFREVRVRHIGDTARVELGDTDWARSSLEGPRERIIAEVRNHGYRQVTIARYQPSGSRILNPQPFR